MSKTLAPVAISDRWRVRGAPWPTDASAECLLFEFLDDVKGWTVRFALRPDGTLAQGVVV